MILFFYGGNTFAARAKLTQLKQQYITKNGNDFGLDQLDGEQLKLQDLVQQLQAVPFLGTSRLVIIENLSKNKSVAEELLKRLEEVPATTIVVLYEPDVDKRGSYFKTLSKLPQAIEFKPLSPPALAKWMNDTVAGLGAKIDRAALDELLKRCGDDQWRLQGEISKLAHFTKHITLAEVEDMVEASEEQNIFAFLDEVMSGNLKSALQSLQVLQQQGMNEIYILTMIQWQLKQLLLAKLSGARNGAELAKAASMSPYAAGKALALASKATEEQLKRYYSLSIDTERGIKTGKAKPDELLEQLVIQLAQGPAGYAI